MELFRLFGTVALQGDTQVNQSLSNMESMAQRMGSGMQSLGNSISSMGMKMTALATVPMVGLIGSTIKYSSEIQNLSTDFKVMLGSTDKATQMMGDLKKMGAETPFEVVGLAQSTKTLLQFGVSQEQVIPTMKRLGDVSLGNNERFQGLSLVFGQISSLGRLQAGDLNQLINRGWNPLNQITAKTGETMEQVRERMKEGKISYKEVEEALKSATDKGGMFYGGMAEGSKTLSGQLSTLKDNFNEMMAKAIAPLFKWLNDKLVPTLTWLVSKFDGLNEKTKTFVILGVLVIGAIGPVLLILGALISAIGTIIGVIGAVSASMWAVIAVIAVVVTSITTFFVVTGKWREVVAMFKVLWLEFKSILIELNYRFEQIKPVVMDMVESVKKYFTNLFNTVYGILKDIAIFLYPFFLKAKSEWFPPIQELAVEVAKFIKVVYDRLSEGLDKVKAIWVVIWPYLQIILKPILDNIISTVKFTINIIKDVISVVTNIIKGDWQGVWNGIKNIFQDTWNWIKSIAQNNINGLMELFNSLAPKARNAWESMKNAIMTSISGLASSLYNSATNMMNMFIKGITDKIASVGNAVGNVAGTVKKFLGFSSPTKEGAGAESDKWMPNLMNMLTVGIESGTPKVQGALSKVIAPPKFNVGSLGARTIAGQTQGLVININDTKLFNTDDIDKIMNPIVSRLRNLGIQGRSF
ncbi:MAG: tape measure protein [Cetobacterium sp.]